MLLDGAKFICLNENGEPDKTIIAKGRNFLIGCQLDCDYILVGAEKIHCQIECDAFGHVTIYNKSEKQPISVNGETVTIKRTLFNNSKIQILDKLYLWKLPETNLNKTTENAIGVEGMSTTDKQFGIPVQPPSSCPTLKYDCNISSRFTVHNLGSYRIQSEESNFIDEDNETKPNNQTTTDEASTSKQFLLDHTPPRVEMIDSTSDKKTSSPKNRIKLTTSTLYKVINKNDKPGSTTTPQLQDTTEYFSALHSSTEEEIEEQAAASNEPTIANEEKVDNDNCDELLKEIRDILRTSDEIKKKIRFLEMYHAGEIGPRSVSPIPTSIELIEPIAKPIDLKNSTKKHPATLVLLKVLNNPEKELLRSPKEDDEKENKKLNEIITKTTMTTSTSTTSATPRRISFSAVGATTTTTTPVVASLNFEDVSSSIISTPLTPKRITKRRPSIDGEITHNRTIDHLSTENMGAIIEDEEEVCASTNDKTEVDQVDEDYITLDASAALTNSVTINKNVCPVKEILETKNEKKAKDIENVMETENVEDSNQENKSDNETAVVEDKAKEIEEEKEAIPKKRARKNTAN